MTSDELMREMRLSLRDEIPNPGSGMTADRHFRLMEFGKRDLSLARLAEAHFDAVAILAEANRRAMPDSIYGVWASEIPGSGLTLTRSSRGLHISGRKMFCSGGSLVDRVLVTVTEPDRRLAEIDLRIHSHTLDMDESSWITPAFQETKTATITFRDTPIAEDDLIGEVEWYLQRPGFWHGACGPASCWAGGAEGLVDYALEQRRKDPHTLAHLAAMQASIWAMRSVLWTAGNEIDQHPADKDAAHLRALKVRHLVERECADILGRFARAYGPYPLSMQKETTLRYQELNLYIRQSHGERDLEQLGQLLIDPS